MTEFFGVDESDEEFKQVLEDLNTLPWIVWRLTPAAIPGPILESAARTRAGRAAQLTELHCSTTDLARTGNPAYSK